MTEGACNTIKYCNMREYMQNYHCPELTLIDTDFNNNHNTRTKFQFNYKSQIISSAKTITKEICCKSCRAEKRFDGLYVSLKSLIGGAVRDCELWIFWRAVM